MTEKKGDIQTFSQNEFDAFVEDSKKGNSLELGQYFSKEVKSALAPITDKKQLIDTARMILDKIKQARPTQKSFDIGFEREKGRDVHSGKNILLHNSDGVDFNMSDMIKTNPIITAKEGFGARINDQFPAYKQIVFDKKLLGNPQANHSAFVAYMTRALSYCDNYKMTKEYNDDEKSYIARLFATHMCKGMTDKGIPVLEGFNSKRQFNDLVNLDLLILQDGKLHNNTNFLAQEQVLAILQATK